MKCLRPKTLEELFSYPDPRDLDFVAGGTDWILKRWGAAREVSTLVDLSRLEELHGISERDGSLWVGAMETMTHLHESPLVRRFAQSLADAAFSMGSEQIRNRATLGGNVANASPAADTPSSLAVLESQVQVASSRGFRTLPLEEVIGYNANTLSLGELIVGFEIPLDPLRVSAFGKVGSRSQTSIARVNLALSGRYEGGVFRDARVYVGTLKTAARRCLEAEEVLSRPSFEETLPETLAAFAARCIPGRPTLPYKQSVLRALSRDLLALLMERTKGGTAR